MFLRRKNELLLFISSITIILKAISRGNIKLSINIILCAIWNKW